MQNDVQQANKQIVRRFNEEVIERGDAAAFRALVAPEFVNRTAPPGVPTGPEGLQDFFERILRPALPDLKVEIHDQIAEGDRVVTRKTLSGTHAGELLGVPPSNRRVRIDVVDIVRVVDGRYVEHWGLTTLPELLAQLRAA